MDDRALLTSLVCMKYLDNRLSYQNPWMISLAAACFIYGSVQAILYSL